MPCHRASGRTVFGGPALTPALSQEGEGDMRAAPALPLAGEGWGEGSPPKPTLAAILPEPLRVAMGFAEDDPLPDFIARVWTQES